MRRYACDTEVYGNYFLAAFKDIESGQERSWEAVDGRLTKRQRRTLLEFLKSILSVTFNGNDFDLPILAAAIAGKDTEQLKTIADDIIVAGFKPWDVEREHKIRLIQINHIDLIEVAPGQASLKIYNGRMHGKRMQDLPYDPSSILTDEEIDNVFNYCFNDLDATIDLYKTLAEQIDLRASMSIEYGLDLRSKSDAQVAEAVIKASIEKATGRKIKKEAYTAGASFYYDAPSFLKFEHPELADVFRDITETKFRVNASGKVSLPESLSSRIIKIGKGRYRMGIGGLHSSEESRSVRAGDGFKIYDADVASFYPRIIINQRLFPEKLGAIFLKVYEKIVDRRLAAKASAGEVKAEIKSTESAMKSANRPSELMAEKLADLKEKLKHFQTIADSLKITINGSFGKFGSRFSVLYAPKLLIQTTVTGQLSLLMLIEWLEAEGIEVISANTDGIVIRCHEDDESLMREILAFWEKRCSFELEVAEYSALHSRDVNNYIAVKTNGETKTKGVFAPTGLQKNPTSAICVKAVCEFLTKGTPIHSTIMDSVDVRDFVTVRTVKGGAKFGGSYLGKAIRWYYAEGVSDELRYSKPNQHGTFNLVPDSAGARPIMTLPREFPGDVDHMAYIRRARSMLVDLGIHKEVVRKPAKKAA